MFVGTKKENWSLTALVLFFCLSSVENVEKMWRNIKERLKRIVITMKRGWSCEGIDSIAKKKPLNAKLGAFLIFFML